MMSRNSRRIVLRKAARGFDLVVVTTMSFTAFVVAAGAFTWPSLAYVLALRIALVNIFLFAGYLALCSLIFSSCGFYRSHRLSRRSRWVKEIFVAVTLITGMLLVLRAPFYLSFATNTFLVVFWFLLFGSLALCREVAQRVLCYARSRGRNLRGLVIVGEGGRRLSSLNGSKTIRASVTGSCE